MRMPGRASANISGAQSRCSGTCRSQLRAWASRSPHSILSSAGSKCRRIGSGWRAEPRLTCAEGCEMTVVSSLMLVRELYEYHWWANRRLFEAAAALGEKASIREMGAQFSEPTVKARFVHVYALMSSGLLVGEDLRKTDFHTIPTLAQC